MVRLSPWYMLASASSATPNGAKNRKKRVVYKHLAPPEQRRSVKQHVITELGLTLLLLPYFFFFFSM